MPDALPQSVDLPVGYRELIRTNEDFRWLWFGQIVSLLGDWFNMIATVALLASLTETGFAIGSLFVVRMLAPFLTSPVAGVVADRYNRRKTLIVADLVRGIIVLGMLGVRTRETAWLLYLLTALQLGVSSFFFTARNAILPDIVERRALGAANAVGSVTWSVMLALGAALGGVAAGALGVYTAFAIDAATFFISAALICQIRRQSSLMAHGTMRLSTALQEYVDGLKFLIHHPDIFAIALHKPALTILFGTTFRVVQAAIAERVFPYGEQGAMSMGIMLGVAGIGTGIGPLVARRFTHDNQTRLRWAMLAGYAMGAVGLVISSVMNALPTVLCGAFLTGAGNGVLWVFSTQLILLNAPAHIRGRVFGSEFAMFALASSIGSAAVGWAMDTELGIAGVLQVMASCAVLPALAWWYWTTKRV